MLTQTVVDRNESIGHINTENADIEEVNINGNNGFILLRYDFVVIFWEMDGYIFSIQGNVDKNTIIYLAKMTIFK